VDCSKFEQTEPGGFVVSLADVQAVWETVKAGGQPEGISMLISLLGRLPAEDRRRFLRGKRGRIDQAIWDCDSRSGAYELSRAAPLARGLEGLGLILDNGRGWRDVETGRRVQTRLRELGRLGWDLEDKSMQEWVTENWPRLVAMPLDELKERVRAINPRARG